MIPGLGGRARVNLKALRGKQLNDFIARHGSHNAVKMILEQRKANESRKSKSYLPPLRTSSSRIDRQ